MKKIVLASHGKLAEGFLNSLKIIIGDNDNIYTLCAYVDEDKTLSEQIEELFDKFQSDDEVIIITDIFGGSVNNEFLRQLPNHKFYLISGMNLSLIIDLIVSNSSNDLETNIKSAVENCKSGIRYCNPLVEQVNLKNEDF